MLNIRVLLILKLISLACCQQRLDINSKACNNYLKKFGTANPDCYGTGPTSLAYTGEAVLVENNIKVNLQYNDFLFDNATYFGLTQEDGKTANETCLDLKIFKFTSIQYKDREQLTDLQFTASNNQKKKQRYLSFTIQKADLANKLILTSNSNNYIYIGYYTISYYAAGTNEVQYTYYFQFSVTISKSSGVSVSSAFLPFNQYETNTCHIWSDCDVGPSTELQFCTDTSCQNNTIPNLYLNDQFYIKQIVKVQGFTNYYLTNTSVYYRGNGLYQKTIPISIDNSEPGQVLLLLNADIIWSNLTIQVTSYLSSVQGEFVRSFSVNKPIQQTIYDPVLGISVNIPCIKMYQNSSQCPTCDEECKVNGFARNECNQCPIVKEEQFQNGNSLIFLFLIGIIIIVFILQQNKIIISRLKTKLIDYFYNLVGFTQIEQYQNINQQIEFLQHNDDV